MKKILIIDDEPDLRLLLKTLLVQKGFQCVEASSGKKAIEALAVHTIDLVLCDLKLGDMEGRDVLQYIKEREPFMPVVIITGNSHIKNAVEIMKLGAVDYLIKPLVPMEILATIDRVLKLSALVKANPPKERTREKAITHSTDAAPYIFSNSVLFQKILDEIRLVAPTNYCIIIYGESGSGKEAIAQEIHKQSNRKNKPFLAIDCGALSKELASSTLFGHEQGAFTGALQQKLGGFEMASGGTVFLDEIANLPYDVQISLLRVIQEKKMRRVGGTKDITIDIRIIVASNTKLWDASQSGTFREDLYHRFNEFSINIPPLRERKEDVLFYAHHFLKLANQELGKNIETFDTSVLPVLAEYAWPGNLRELKNVIKRAALLAESTVISLKDLPVELVEYKNSENENSEPPSGTPVSEKTLLSHANIIKHYPITNAAEIEYKRIVEALEGTNFNKLKAAALLNMDSRTFFKTLKAYQALKGHEE